MATLLFASLCPLYTPSVFSDITCRKMSSPAITSLTILTSYLIKLVQGPFNLSCDPFFLLFSLHGCSRKILCKPCSFFCDKMTCSILIAITSPNIPHISAEPIVGVRPCVNDIIGSRGYMLNYAPFLCVPKHIIKLPNAVDAPIVIGSLPIRNDTNQTKQHQIEIRIASRLGTK